MVNSGVQYVDPSLSALYISPASDNRSYFLPVSNPEVVNSLLEEIIFLFCPFAFPKRWLYRLVPSIQALSSCVTVSHKISDLEESTDSS